MLHKSLLSIPGHPCVAGYILIITQQYEILYKEIMGIYVRIDVLIIEQIFPSVQSKVKQHQVKILKIKRKNSI